jgi:heterodisulfide reductase subunit A-like polyferredoxin
MTAVFVCSCGRRSGESWLGKVTAAVGGRAVFGSDSLCRAPGLKLVREKAKKEGAGRILLAGCPALESAAYRAAAAKAAGLAPADVSTVVLPPKASAAAAARAIMLARAGLDLTPAFETRTVPLEQDVLVVGSGPAADEAARHVRGFGHRAVVIGTGELPVLEGAVGSFRAAGRSFGAVVIAAGLAPRDPAASPFVPGKVVPLGSLEQRLASLHRRDRPRSAAFLLDLEIDETKASWSAAVRTAMAVRAAYKTEVTILQRDVRVAGRGLEKLYDDARDAGIVFIKFEGRPRVSVTADGVSVSCRDSVAGEDITLVAAIAAASEGGLATAAPAGLADAAGILVDAYGRLQENNIHLLPDQTNRTGVFVAGPCRGEQDPGTGLRDARAAALAAHQLLSQKELPVELSHPVVDPDKCVLCLTCIRSCPFKAMRIFMEEKRADSVPEACRRCGICAGECPAKAITLPAHSDAIVMARAGAVPATAAGARS